MPQSWPSQWTVLFILFIFSFFLVMILTYFFSSKDLVKKSSLSFNVSIFNWSW